MFRKITALFLAVIILSGQVVDTVRAIDFDEPFFSSNQIFYYDARCASETAQGMLSVTGKDNLEIILKFFMQKGLTLAQASGIAGNMSAESGLDPTIIQGGGHAQPGYRPQSGVGFGLVQWTSGGRQQKLVDFIYGGGSNDSQGGGLGVDITDINGQLNFAWKELSEDYPNTLTALKGTDDPVEAAVIVHDGYESSADSKAQVITNRGGNATKFYTTYVDKDPLAGSTSPDTTALASKTTDNKGSSKTSTASGGCVGSEFSGGDLGDTTKAYAWPAYISAGGSTNSMPGFEGRTIKATDMMEAYAQAITKAKADGQYVGGIRLSGIDCGGAVTRIIIDSGFEPNYNYSGKSANGAGYTGIQEKWLKQNWETISATDAGDRQPGDVAINDSHTYLYVGEEVFASKIVSASLDERAPMQGHESVTDSSFRWYRKKVNLTGVEL
ncbi:MAG: phage tail tip lysozyme [Candidatus Saccharimonadales bacterium]